MHASTNVFQLFSLLLAASTARAQFKCEASSSIPYCVHQPEGSSGPLPLMVSMPGSGARGSLSNAASLATYDGHGRMIREYYDGNKDERHTIAATRFLTVVPISPDGSRHFWPEDIKGIIEDVQSKYQVQGKKAGISGYSMGSRGCNRFVVTYPELVDSAGCSAGAAEQEYDGTLTQDPSRTASATFPLLSKAVNVPMQLFAGMSDETAGYTSTQAEYKQLQSLGAKSVQLVELQGASHSDMSIKPWADTDYLSWALSLASSSSGGSTKTRTRTSSMPTKTSTKGSKTTKSVAATPTATTDSSGSDTTSDDEDEDCEDEEDQEPEDDEDDCEDEEDQETEGDEDDCDDDEESDDSADTSETADEEDCEDEEDDSSNSTVAKRDLPHVDPPVGRQPHHFVFSHSRRDLGAQRHAHQARAIPLRHRMVRVKRH